MKMFLNRQIRRRQNLLSFSAICLLKSVLTDRGFLLLIRFRQNSHLIHIKNTNLKVVHRTVAREDRENDRAGDEYVGRSDRVISVLFQEVLQLCTLRGITDLNV